MRLLIIDDDVVLAKSLYTSLKKSYAIDLAHSAEAGEYAATVNDYDALIIDFNLPDRSGVDLAGFLRADNCKVPMLMLTGRTEIEDKVHALDNGLDDYLLKPFSKKELEARLRALLRRQPLIMSHNVLTFADLQLDVRNKILKQDNYLIPLRRKEYELLEFFMRHPDQILSREVLLEHVWSEHSEPNTHAVDAHIKNLRKKLRLHSLGKNYIKTEYGYGYRLQK